MIRKLFKKKIVLITNKVMSRVQGTNYFFIHIPKNGGTSFINHFCNKKHTGHHVKPHKSVKTVCIVRNPYDRLVSCYEYARSDCSYWHKHGEAHVEHPIVRIRQKPKQKQAFQTCQHPTAMCHLQPWSY